MGPEEIVKRLKDWPRGLNLDQRKTVRQALTACRSFFDASRVILAWEEHEEPWLIVATISDSGFMWIEEQPDRYMPLVDASHENQVFVGDAVAIHSEFRATFGLSDVVSAPIRGEVVQGRMFVADPRERSLLAAEIAALLLERTLDYTASLRFSTRDAVHEERL